MTESAPLRQELLSIMLERAPALSDAAFNDLALRIFQFQFANNAPYRKYCERRIQNIAGVRHWLNVPAVPTAAFKEAVLVSGDEQAAQAIFRTSGTTQGAEKRGAHYVLDLELYEQSLLPAFRHFVLGGQDGMAMISLVAPWQSGGESSLSYMISTVMRELGAPESRYAVTASGIDHEALHQWLAAKIDVGEAVCIVGTSLAFVHWFDHLRASGQTYGLPAGSRIMDTGGFKGSTRAITSEQLRAEYHDLLGIDAQHVVNEYGMTEMLTQFYDAHLADNESMLVKRGPAWVRSAIVHPETLEPLPAGETGLLRHFDLANLLSVSAIQTEDLAVAREDGFVLLGRAAGAAPRGCSIAMDIFLSAART